jgi:hypothetical protein
MTGDGGEPLASALKRSFKNTIGVYLVFGAALAGEFVNGLTSSFRTGHVFYVTGSLAVATIWGHYAESGTIKRTFRSFVLDVLIFFEGVSVGISVIMIVRTFDHPNVGSLDWVLVLLFSVALGYPAAFPMLVPLADWFEGDGDPVKVACRFRLHPAQSLDEVACSERFLAKPGSTDWRRPILQEALKEAGRCGVPDKETALGGDYSRLYVVPALGGAFFWPRVSRQPKAGRALAAATAFAPLGW